MRSVLSVVAGFVVVMGVVMAGTAAATELIVPGGLRGAVASTREAIPATYFAANLVISVLAAVLGGWVTARMAPSREMAHVAGLACLMILMSLPALLGYGDPQSDQPSWYNYTLPVLGVGGALFGGWMRSRVVVT